MSEKIQCSRCRNHKPESDYDVTNTGRRLQTCNRCRGIKNTRYKRQNTGCGPDYRKPKQPEILGDDKRYLIALRKSMIDVGGI